MDAQDCSAQYQKAFFCEQMAIAGGCSGGDVGMAWLTWVGMLGWGMCVRWMVAFGGCAKRNNTGEAGEVMKSVEGNEMMNLIFFDPGSNFKNCIPHKFAFFCVLESPIKDG